MRLFKWLFSSKSKSKKYKPEIFLLCYLVFISLIVIFVVNVIGVSKTLNLVMSWVVLAQWLILIVPCLIRMFDVSDYKEIEKAKKAN